MDTLSESSGSYYSDECSSCSSYEYTSDEYTSDEELIEESKCETVEYVEETKYPYDLDTVVAEITKNKPRSRKQIFIDMRVEELKTTEPGLEDEEIHEIVENQWEKMADTEKIWFKNKSANEKKRYQIAMGIPNKKFERSNGWQLLR